MGDAAAVLMQTKHLKNVTLGIAMLLGVAANAQDVKLNVTYVCSGERMYVESCNIRDLSDTSTCQVAHPDRPKHNGFMAYTSETRGSLKKLLPTCTQPSEKELAAAEAFKKKQQEIYDANVAKANPQASVQGNGQSGNQSAARGSQGQAAVRINPPKNAEERAMRRCISSGRIAATCTGNSLLGAFGQMVSQVLPSAAKEPAPGPEIAGVFEGAGSWRLDFIDGGVLVNCGVLAPDQHSYTFDFKNNRAAIVIDTTPKPLVLTLGADGTSMSGPGPVVLDGVIVTGYDSGLRDASGNHVEAATAIGPVYDEYGQRVSRTSNSGHATFASKRVTCPALNLSTKGARVGVQTMQTDLLKSIFNDGDKGPPTPPGIRMHGIFAASTGFSVQFFPESVILGCGPDAARAYPYTVVADGTKSGIKIDAPDHPLTLAFRPDGSLDAGSGPYQVHGRIVIGQNDNDDFTFAPMEQTCNLGGSGSQQSHSIGRRHGCAGGCSGGAWRWHRRRRPLNSSRAARQRRSIHRLRISRAGWRSESARRASLRSSARQLRRRTRKRRRLRSRQECRPSNTWPLFVPAERPTVKRFWTPSTQMQLQPSGPTPTALESFPVCPREPIT